uniref:DDE Tnp4 domain-containing protein n=1 Tax=Brassica oleracea var. oleracea TaxID=109376 RepID=A0A0D3D2J6_BRAOL
MSSSSSDDLEERLEEIIDEYVEDTFNNIVEGRTINQRGRAYIERHRKGGHIQLWNDYFSEDSTFSSELFRRRFRMNKGLFLRIVHRLSECLPFFQQRRDATGRLGLTPLQKCTAAIRLLAYGSAAETVDEYLRLEQRGFSGMIGSIDCMHWEWKNCPSAWKGQYTRGSGKLTIVLEAVASQDLWIWHAFFGPPGTLNDINVLERGPVFDDIIEGRAPRVRYMVNGHMYKLAYYLTDGIYPKWSTFIQSITLPQCPKQELFAKVQEATGKDVERAFGVLQARFAIVKNPVKTLDKAKISKIMRACIILHNMIVENVRDGYGIQFDISDFEEGDVTRSSRVEANMPTNLNNIFPIRNDVRDTRIHEHLKTDLIEHIWNKFGDEY